MKKDFTHNNKTIIEVQHYDEQTGLMDNNKGVAMIDQFNRVFANDNMYICDGSLISSNPGVNPLLGICAIVEKTRHHIPPKKQ